MVDVLLHGVTKYPLVTAFVVVGIIMYVAGIISKVLGGRVHSSAIAIVMGLALAYFGGKYSGGKHGLADVGLFSGLGLMGGSVFRDFAIVSTAFGAKLEELKKAGVPGVVSLFVSVAVSMIIGGAAAIAFGYTDPVEITTIGAGAVTFIVGPVTGNALGASSEVIALSVAAGVVKSITVMVTTPFLAKAAGLDNPAAACVYGGLMGSTSGVAAGLAATDARLVPYGALTATFYTGLGCLLCPSVGYMVVLSLFG